MLSYQHMYHAGCFADIYKHNYLCDIIEHMKANYPQINYIDTHAGRGFYDLSISEAQKTGEAKNGIIKLLKEDKIPKDSCYYKIIAKIKAEKNINYYPGSPYIAQKLLSHKDYLYFTELHPKEYEELCKNIQGVNIIIHKLNFYDAVLSLDKKLEENSLLLIDPSYEVKSEYDVIYDFIIKINKKHPNLKILLWYPILTQSYHHNMISKFTSSSIRNLKTQELPFPIINRALGTGLLTVNIDKEPNNIIF